MFQTHPSGAILADDPDAVEKLRAKLARLEASRDRIKAYNASARKGAPDESILSPREVADLHSCLRVWGEEGRVHRQTAYRGFPRYVLTNLGARISNVKGRLARLEGDR